MESDPNGDRISDENQEGGIHTEIDKVAGYAHRSVERGSALVQDVRIPEKMTRVKHHIRTHPMKAVSIALVVGLVIGLIF
jgi:ElaB/YqjD/DUF883 family membrane-anchored ribosome-binding protein